MLGMHDEIQEMFHSALQNKWISSLKFNTMNSQMKGNNKLISHNFTEGLTTVLILSHWFVINLSLSFTVFNIILFKAPCSKQSN